MLEKISNNIKLEEEISEIVICGDPGCDGYNTSAVSVFEEILKIKADFTMVVGDLVPYGEEKYYNEFTDIVNTSAKNSVYCLTGNHDIANYEKFIGKKNYFIQTPNELFIILDNSKRYFDDKTIEFLKNTLENNSRENIFVFFHIPPPNPFILNNFIDEEWQKIKSCMDNFKDKIKFLFCGHVHTAFDYNLDGYRIIATGGAGAELDEIENIFLKNNLNHTFKLIKVNDKWNIEFIEIPYYKVNNNYKNEVVENLNKSFSGESQAYRKYLLYSEIAEMEGYKNISKLFKVISESEFVHSKNMIIASSKLKNTLQNLKEAILSEQKEFETIYPDFIRKSEKNKSNKAYNALNSALLAEKTHYKFLKEALESLEKGKDLESNEFYVCSRCGYTHRGKKSPLKCPICGTDMYKFGKVV